MLKGQGGLTKTCITYYCLLSCAPNFYVILGRLQWWNSSFWRTGSLTPGLTNNWFSYYHSLQRQTMLVDPI